jgi:DNA-binding NtrC family response regulator
MVKERKTNRRILLVDDETALLMAFKKLLQSSIIDVDTAETLDEVKFLLKNNVYDVIIADLRLTGATKEEGLEIIHLAKEYRPGTEVILVTAYGNQEIMEKTYQLGAAYYFEKPVSGNVLKEALKNLGII